MMQETSDGRRRTRTGETLGKAKTRARETAAAAKARANAAYDGASERAGRAYDATRRGARQAGQRTAQGVDDSPLAVLFGGLALGAVVGAFLPRTRRESEVLGPLGKRVNQTAAGAARAAREAGTQKLDSMGVNREGARRKVDELVDTAGRAASSAGKAAARAVRQPKNV